MRTIRRLYFYAVALISLEVILWGLISLLRTMFSQDVLFPTATTLAQALALILVGIPVFLLHWLSAQRFAASDMDEKSSTVRAVFFYLALLLTLLPLSQNILAVVDRTFIETVQLNRASALFGGSQTWQDNLIAILMNGVAAAYFWVVLRSAWGSLPDDQNFADVRRVYRYTWVAYGLLLVVAGAQQVIYGIFAFPGDILMGVSGRESAINGMSMLLVGAPIWLYTWQTCQHALEDPQEQGSDLRLGMLYLLSILGLVVLLFSGGALLDMILRIVLGESLAWDVFARQIGSPLSLGIPMGVIWAYYGRWFWREADSRPDVFRRAGIKRLYEYVLSLLGLAATLTGMAQILSFLVDFFFLPDAVWGDLLRSRLSGALSTLFIGLPLWALTWRPMQAESRLEGEAGDHARQSIVRRVYLYLVIFAAVIGGMISAVFLAFTLLNAALGGQTAPDFFASVLNSSQVLLLFVAVLVYHILTLRQDGGRSAGEQSRRYRDFPVLVIERADSGFGRRFAEALSRQVDALPVAVQVVEQPIPEGAESAQVVVLPAELALNPPEAMRSWLNAYEGQRVVVSASVPGWVWAAGAPSHPELVAARIVRQLADGETPNLSAGLPAWTVVAYVFAGLFALQVLFILFALGISLVAGF